MHEAINAHRLLGLIAGDVRTHVASVAIWFTALTAIGVAADLAPDEQTNRLLLLLVSCVATVAQYAVIRVSVADLAPPGRSLGSFARFFLLSLITSLGVFLGFAVFLVPGILLAVRWSTTAPTLIAGNFGVGDALRYGWHSTANIFCPILIVLAAIWVPAAGLIGASIWYDWEAISIAGSLVFNVSLDAALIATWLANAAIFRADLQREDGRRRLGGAVDLA